jgi:hypothetical protein
MKPTRAFGEAEAAGELFQLGVGRNQRIERRVLFDDDRVGGRVLRRREVYRCDRSQQDSTQHAIFSHDDASLQPTRSYVLGAQP